MFGAIFYVYKKEVQKMNDLIELKLITRKDAECLHKLQIEAFMPLYVNGIIKPAVFGSEKPAVF